MKLLYKPYFLVLALLFSLVSSIDVPTHPQGEVRYHDFTNTPFLNEQDFENSLISGSANITFQQINEKNQGIRSSLESLVHEPFFRIFKLNLFKSCPFWEQDGFCLYRSCAVDTINDWADLPEIWRPEELGKLQGTEEITNKQKQSADKPLDGNECIDEIENNNYCHIDGADEDCVYVDLVENPERFTGYGGEQSFQIWKLIYDENCFFEDSNALSNNSEPQCIEKQIFYRLISGMHSSISTHLTNDYLNLTTKEYGPNLLQFMFKVGDFPDRIENMYLNYILVVKSLIKLYQSNYLDQLSLCAPEFSQKENELKHGLKDLVEPFLTLSNGKSDEILFNEKDLFQNPDGVDMKNEFKMRFRNVSSIMDCVHCDRCRVWGKLQTIGYGTALKVLFELDEDHIENFSMEKIELIALINTFDRLSKSVVSVINFEKMFNENYQKENLTTLETSSSSSSKTTTEEEQAKIHKVKKQIQDFSAPEVVEKPKPREKQTLKEAFMTELHNVQDALTFIWESYFSLPKNIFDITALRISKYWNSFIGVEEEPLEMDEDSYLQTLFDRSQHTE